MAGMDSSSVKVTIVSGVHLHHTDKYQGPFEIIGRDFFDIFFLACTVGTEKKVLIRKYTCAFLNFVDVKRMLREIRLLNHFKHDYVVDIKDVYISSEDEGEDADVYVVYEQLEMGLHNYVGPRKRIQLSGEMCKHHIRSMLYGLTHIHSAGVVHRHLKPESIVFNHEDALRIFDLRLAGRPNEDDFMQEYASDTWYHAPELLLRCPTYSTASDIWSVGCIIMQMLGSETLFPGKYVMDQLELIVRLIGSPSDEEMKFLGRTEKRTMEGLGKYPSTFDQVYQGKFPKLALDLVKKMLKFDPNDRISAKDALAEPYLAFSDDDESDSEEIGDDDCYDGSTDDNCAPFNFDSEEEIGPDTTVEEMMNHVKQARLNILNKAVVLRIDGASFTEGPVRLDYEPTSNLEEEDEKQSIDGLLSDPGWGSNR